MNSKAVKLSEKVSNEMAAIADATRLLFEAIRDEDEDAINDLADGGFPPPKKMADTFAKLGVLLQERPWEKRSKV